MATTIVDRDNGYARLLRTVLGAQRVTVKVGVIHDAPHAGGNGKTVGEIAEIHEIGRGNVPARPWLRPIVDGKRAEIQARLKIIATETAAGRITTAQGMDQLGLAIVGAIKRRIVSGINPPLAASTIARKINSAGQHKDTPLIDTAQFLGSITHEVEIKGTGAAKKIGTALGKAHKAVAKRGARLIKASKRAAKKTQRLANKTNKSVKKALRKTRKARRK